VTAASSAGSFKVEPTEVEIIGMKPTGEDDVVPPGVGESSGFPQAPGRVASLRQTWRAGLARHKREDVGAGRLLAKKPAAITPRHTQF